jgi:hypothetical protein
MIRITSSIDGFRRAGIAHTRVPAEYADDAFTKEQMKQLQAEPVLLVEIVPEKKK